MSRTVLLELLPIQQRNHISLLSERLFIGCLSSIALFSLLPYWSYEVDILNTLNLSLNPGIMCTKLLEVNLMVCCLRYIIDAPRIRNGLPDEVCLAKFLSFPPPPPPPPPPQKKTYLLQTYLFAKS